MKTMIEGWACKLYDGGTRGATRQDGRGILFYVEGGISGSDCYVPPAVAAWLRVAHVEPAPSVDLGAGDWSAEVVMRAEPQGAPTPLDPKRCAVHTWFNPEPGQPCCFCEDAAKGAPCCHHPLTEHDAHGFCTKCECGGYLTP